MKQNQYDKILSLVEKPSRYLGTEPNSIKKDPSGVKLRFALAFPDLYEIGTSHFGMQILYHVLNQQKEIAAERFFTPAPDMEHQLRRYKAPLVSLESRTPMGGFDIVGFSLLYELNYTNVLTMLDLSSIPFRAEQRRPEDPMVIAGGPCTCNPEPVAELFDAMVVGDGEQVVLDIAGEWRKWRASGSRDKSDLIERWEAIEGVYVPSRNPVQGLSLATNTSGEAPSVSRAVVEELETAPFPQRPVVPFGRPVHDRLRLEVSRGCTRGCRFCQAGMIYRPVRERSCRQLLDLAETSLDATGYEDLSLLSLSTGDYSRLDSLLQGVMNRCQEGRVAVSLPSIRAGSLTPAMMEQIRRVRKTGFTIAPEAGSQRLRNVINKNLTEEEIFKSVADAFSLGWQVVKLYFMVGLPSETDDDRDALVDLVLRLRALRKKAKRSGRINVSLATFIPKPHTPFQWCQQIGRLRAEQILASLRERLTVPGIQVKWQSPDVSWLEGLFARGDRRLLPMLEAAWRKGCRLDGWSDHFRFDMWCEAVKEAGLDADFFITRRRDPEEPLPWDHIDTKVAKSYLREEYERAMEERHTPDCRWGDCNDCGVCDFDRIAPVVGRPGFADAASGEAPPSGGGGRIRVEYSKTGDARFFGHLEMVSLFIRALRRAGFPMAYSKGFHPKPRIAFSEPLPVGMESEEEFFDLQLSGMIDLSAAVERFQERLPAGFTVLGGRHLSGKKKESKRAVCLYHVVLNDLEFDSRRLAGFESADQWPVTRRSAKGTLKKRDLKDMVVKIEILSSTKAVLQLRSEPGRTLRPAEVLEEVFGFSGEQVRSARVVKTRKDPTSDTCHV